MNVNPNHRYFDGFYQEIWRQIIPEQLTHKEVEHLLETYHLQNSTRLLDLMCGPGRHTLALARNGVAVTALDNLASYIQQIDSVSRSEALPVQAICSNLLDWAPIPGHDWALCMGNSLNFFSPEELSVVLRKVSDSLIPGGYFWINSWSISEIALQKPFDGEIQTAQLGRFRHTNHFRLKQDPLRMEIESRIEDESGQVEEKLAVDFLYSLDELQKALEEAGLRLIKAESIPGKKPFSTGDPRIYILSQKSI